MKQAFKTNDSPEGIKVIAEILPKVYLEWHSTENRIITDDCGYSIHHLYLIFGRSVKMSCINRKRWKLGAFEIVFLGLLSMPHQLANLKKAEIKTIELLIPTHLSPATVAIQSARLLSPKGGGTSWQAMSHCILKNAHSQHRYCRLLWQWDGWFLPRGKTATVMPERIRAVHESMALGD